MPLWTGSRSPRSGYRRRLRSRPILAISARTHGVPTRTGLLKTSVGTRMTARHGDADEGIAMYWWRGPFITQRRRRPYNLSDMVSSWCVQEPPFEAIGSRVWLGRRVGCPEEGRG